MESSLHDICGGSLNLLNDMRNYYKDSKPLQGNERTQTKLKEKLSERISENMNLLKHSSDIHLKETSNETYRHDKDIEVRFDDILKKTKNKL